MAKVVVSSGVVSEWNNVTEDKMIPRQKLLETAKFWKKL